MRKFSFETACSRGNEAVDELLRRETNSACRSSKQVLRNMDADFLDGNTWGERNLDPFIKISVIVPVYNPEEKWLRQAIASILNQTLHDIEVILVDDGSTDNFPQICDDYALKDSRISVIHQDNRGLGCARNSGLKAASGKYVLYVDADDWIERNACEILYRKAEKDDLDVLFFGVTGFDEQKKESHIYDDFSQLPPSVFQKTLCWQDDEVSNHLFRINQTAWSKLFRRDFLIRNNLFFRESLQFEDSEFFYRFVFKADKLGFIPDCLYCYRQNVPNSIMGGRDRRHFDVLTVADFIKAALQENGVFEQFEIQYYNWKYPVVNRRYQDIKKEFKREFKKLIVENFHRDGLTNSKLELLSRKVRKIHGFFLKRKHFLSIFFQNIISYLGRKRGTPNHRLVRVVYSWKGDDRRHNWIFDNVEFTTEKVKKCDLLVVLNASKKAVEVKARQAWCLTFEPPVPEVMDGFKNLFGHYDKVYTACKSDAHSNIINTTALSEWWIGKSHHDLLTLPIPEKEDRVVWVTGNLDLLEGHRKRMAFLNYVRQNADFEIYGKGMDPIDSKWPVYRHAKYTMGIENTFADDYWTEKIADSFLAYSMPIYYGCPNIGKYFPEEAIIRIDIEKPHEAMDIIRKAIEANWWEKNFDAVVKARELVLNRFWYPRFVIHEMKKTNFDKLNYRKFKIPKFRP